MRLLFIVYAACSLTAHAQGFGDTPTFTCVIATEVPPVVRAEGKAEILGDLLLRCTGGAPTPAGSPVPIGVFQIFLNTSPATTPYSSRAFTGALLVVDDPHSVANPNVPLLPCTSATDRCSITGDGLGAATYNGTPGHPNVFEAFLDAFNTPVWFVPFEAPPPGQTRLLRFKNLRADVSQLGSTVNFVTSFLSVNGSQQVTITSGQSKPLAFIQRGLSSSIPAFTTLRTCVAANPGIAGDPTKALDSGGQSGAQFNVVLQENFPLAFRPKNIAQQLANAPGSGNATLVYPPDLNQNIGGSFLYNSETGFFNFATDPLSPTIPALPATPAFPSVNGLNLAGAANQGTRVFVRLAGVPAGLSVFVPATIPGLAVLTATDANGAGPYAPIPGNAAGLAAIPVSGGAAMAVYEVLYTDGTKHSFSIPVALAFSASALSSSLSGQGITVQTGFAPLNSLDLPNFAVSALNTPAFLFQGCSQPDLTLSMTHTGNFVPSGSGTFTLIAHNSGDTPTSGIVTLTDNLPTGLVATALSGGGWSCSLSSVTCTRSDSLPAGGSYPAVFLVVSIAPDSPGAVTNSASATGGGETVIGNDFASETIVITPPQVVRVTTTPPGLIFSVDGVFFLSEQTFSWVAGSIHTIAVDSPQTLRGTSSVFNRWSDAGAMSHSVTAGGAASYTAIYGPPASALQCILSNGVPSIMRGEGQAELAGDLVLQCQGGTPTPAGGAVPQVDIRLALNANITSRMVSPGFSEALLVVDDPHSPQVPGAPANLLACGAPGTNDNGSGVCAATGDGTGRNTYNGTAGHPNVFQGQPGAVNEIVWKGVPIDAPGVDPVGGFQLTRTFRLTNIRVNASQIPLLTELNPARVIGSLSITPGGLAISTGNSFSNGNPLTVGFVMGGLRPAPNTVASFSRCASANPAILSDPTRTLDAGAQNGAQFSLLLTENYSAAFSVKNYAQFVGKGTLYPADVNQNVPGYSFNSETGFFNGTAFNSTLPYLAMGPPTPAFPAARGLNMAGRADSGARIYAKFSPVPDGMKLFVPVTVRILPTGAKPADLQTGAAVLTATDANGAGPFSPVSGNASGWAPLTVTNGVALAVYEFTSEHPNVLDDMTIPVAAAFPAYRVAPGQINVESGFAPISTIVIGDSNSSIPRFANLSNVLPAFNIPAQVCDVSTVTTIAASSVTSNSAVLNGTVNPNGLATLAQFGWYPLGGPASTPTAPVAAGSGTSTVSYSASLTGLLSSTTYYFQAAGSNSAGLANGSLLNFTTAGAQTVAAGWTLAMAHPAVFIQGFPGATYTITVSNTSNAAKSGFTLIGTLPPSLTLVSMAGAGWTCTGATCLQASPIAAGATSQIIVTVNVAPNAPASFTSQAALSGAGLAAPLIAFDPTSAIPIPSALFVRQIYRDLLGREPDPSGLAYWQGLLDSGALTRAQVASSIFTSPEFTQWGLYPIKLYVAVLGRDPDFGGWQFWSGLLRTGSTPVVVLNSFLGSPEFQNSHANLSNGAFVTLAYQNVLGRLPDPGGLAYWTGLLDSARLTRADVMGGFINGAEFDQLVRPRAYANLCYMAFLRRSADPGGLTYWTAYLGGNPLSSIVDSFIRGPEYLNRLSQIAP